jgi:hypothetical protein
MSLVAERGAGGSADRHQQAEMPFIEWLVGRLRFEIDGTQHLLECDEWSREHRSGAGVSGITGCPVVTGVRHHSNQLTKHTLDHRPAYLQLAHLIRGPLPLHGRNLIGIRGENQGTPGGRHDLREQFDQRALERHQTSHSVDGGRHTHQSNQVARQTSGRCVRQSRTSDESVLTAHDVH